MAKAEIVKQKSKSNKLSSKSITLKKKKLLKKTSVKKNQFQKRKGIGKQQEKKGVVYLSHIPHGFYEDQIQGYFSQFGKVTAVSVPRSKTGRAKGYAFIEFQHPEVAKIAAETMDNYLMFNRLLKAKYIPPDKQKPFYFQITEANRLNHTTPSERAGLKIKHNRKVKNRPLKIELEAKVASKLIRRNKKIKKNMEKLGIAYDFEVEEGNLADVFRRRKELREKKKNAAQNGVESEIESSSEELFSEDELELSSLESDVESTDMDNKGKDQDKTIININKKTVKKNINQNQTTNVDGSSLQIKCPKNNYNEQKKESSPFIVKSTLSKISKQNTPKSLKMTPKIKKLEKSENIVMEVDENDKEINFKTPPNVTKKFINREKSGQKMREGRKTPHLDVSNQTSIKKSPSLVKKSPITSGKKIRHRAIKKSDVKTP